MESLTTGPELENSQGHELPRPLVAGAEGGTPEAAPATGKVGTVEGHQTACPTVQRV